MRTLTNDTINSFQDELASFGPDIPDNGIHVMISVSCESPYNMHHKLISFKNSAWKYMNFAQISLICTVPRNNCHLFTGLCVGCGARYSNQKMHPVSSQNSRCQYFRPVDMDSIDAKKWMQVWWDGSYYSKPYQGMWAVYCRKLLFILDITCKDVMIDDNCIPTFICDNFV